jgi:hypothetical protein
MKIEPISEFETKNNIRFHCYQQRPEDFKPGAILKIRNYNYEKDRYFKADTVDKAGKSCRDYLKSILPYIDAELNRQIDIKMPKYLIKPTQNMINKIQKIIKNNSNKSINFAFKNTVDIGTKEIVLIYLEE